MLISRTEFWAYRSLHFYNHLVFDKKAKNKHWRKKTATLTNCPDQTCAVQTCEAHMEISVQILYKARNILPYYLTIPLLA